METVTGGNESLEKVFVTGGSFRSSYLAPPGPALGGSLWKHQRSLPRFLLAAAMGSLGTVTSHWYSNSQLATGEGGLD